ncbi:hypothetical protein [Flavihumibacter petaseus]|uniref:Uncharacterized protein n=1 Tax=Flavihumibacter petaseus NBRC 106054 TaxID=1220578 RepID=A0A0E9N5B8_9BACT|nr:hypothetical protein [Flavihumibacter petaseus]GAO44871.1 hypothetical protein FPE01S_04_01140 [Flavihumibacter petaseus NBRC 106054]
MGHFIIDLPGNMYGDVRFGTIRRKSFSLAFWKKKPAFNEKRIGYIVNVSGAAEGIKRYQFLKTTDGHWTTQDLENFHVAPDDVMTMAIKAAIDQEELNQ